MRKSLIALLAVALTAATASAAWVQKQAMTTARFEPGVATDGSYRIWVFGGTNTAGAFLRDHEMYNANTNTWVSKPQAPAGGLAFAKGVFWGLQLFIPGGMTNGGVIDDQYIYDTLLNWWLPNSADPAPVARYGYSYDLIGDYAYMCGGADSSDNAKSDCYRYDLDGDTWTSIASMDFPRKFHGSGVINNKLYVFGGLTTSEIELNALDVFDPVTGTWSAKANMPTYWHGGSGVAVDGYLVYSHGNSGVGFFNNTYVYSPGSNSWTWANQAVQQAREFPAAASTGGAAYVMGGDPDAPFGFPSSVVEANESPVPTSTTTTTTTKPPTTTTTSSSTTTTPPTTTTTTPPTTTTTTPATTTTTQATTTTTTPTTTTTKPPTTTTTM
ncbi:hypothetical protein K8I61_01375, partial [bacterium]|nr:hypothetical protein [bacterium]